MPKIQYIRDKKFSTANAALIAHAQSICDEYVSQGFTLTLRQLYYQFVARDLIPNTQREYKRLGSVINDARLVGALDWNHLIDRTRNLVANSHWSSPQEIISSAAAGYAIDKWQDQPNRVEVWIEKDALVGVIARVCEDNDVPYFSCRGYTSQSEMWAAGQRLGRYARNNQQPVVVHLGDHDPSGIDMTRDVEDRLSMFAGHPVTVRRIALNMDQVDTYNPPPNPAKLSDTRARDYIAEHGSSSWELDALEPKVLEELIRNEIHAHRDSSRWGALVDRESQERRHLTLVRDEWAEILDYLGE